ncbi:MAG TPA: hypothetical protein VFR12_08450 [Pyrinomonadaceae bacterium]|nr:hypothetical protein [Pyrinomonadaceae bacterium]
MLNKNFSRKGAKTQSYDLRHRRSSFASLRLCASILVFALSLATPTFAQSKFDPDGAFWLLDQPTEFSEFGAINLNAKKLRRLPPAGLQRNDGANYRFKTLTVKRNNLTFTTVTRSGIYYTFSGRFLKGGVFAMTELNDESPILEGTLTRYRDGKKVAEAKLRFTYFGGT